jgi:uncharacterized protein (TIGR02118 family)
MQFEATLFQLCIHASFSHQTAYKKREDEMIALRSAAIVAGILASSAAFAAEAKITVVYAQPKSVEEFDKYYFEKHMPLVYAVKEVKKVEIARPAPGPNGAAPPHHLITEIWFESPEVLKAVTATPEWKAIAADVANFAAPGGSTAFVSVVEPKH